MSSRPHDDQSEQIAEEVAALWAQELGVDDVGVDDNLFSLGANSLLTARMGSQLRERYAVEIPLASLLSAPTAAGAADVIASAQATSRLEPGEDDELLSSTQRRVWFDEHTKPGQPLYHVPVSFHLRGVVSREALTDAVAALAERHSALRSSFRLDPSGVPRRTVEDQCVLDLAWVDLRPLPGAERPSEIERLVKADCRAPFSLEQAPLVRATLFQLADDEALLLFVFHHLVIDAFSVALLAKDLSKLYLHFQDGSSRPSAPAFGYHDFVRFEREALNEQALAQRLSFWERELAGAPALLDMPLDRPRPSRQTFAGAGRQLLIEQDLVLRLQRLAREEEQSLFTAQLSLFALALAEWTRGSDIVIGAATTGRPRTEFGDVCGFFVNMVPLRVYLEQPSFRALIRATGKRSVQAFANEVPFDLLLKRLRPRRTLQHRPLFQVALTQDAPLRLEIPGVSSEAAFLFSNLGTAKYDLTWQLFERDQGLLVEIEYNSNLFDPPTIDRLAELFTTLLHRALDEPDSPPRL